MVLDIERYDSKVKCDKDQFIIPFHSINSSHSRNKMINEGDKVIKVEFENQKFKEEFQNNIIFSPELKIIDYDKNIEEDLISNASESSRDHESFNSHSVVYDQVNFSNIYGQDIQPEMSNQQFR